MCLNVFCATHNSLVLQNKQCNASRTQEEQLVSCTHMEQDPHHLLHVHHCMPYPHSNPLYIASGIRVHDNTKPAASSAGNVQRAATPTTLPAECYNPSPRISSQANTLPAF
jgi:hypothetical protein